MNRFEYTPYTQDLPEHNAPVRIIPDGVVEYTGHSALALATFGLFDTPEADHTAPVFEASPVSDTLGGLAVGAAEAEYYDYELAVNNTDELALHSLEYALANREQLALPA